MNKTITTLITAGIIVGTSTYGCKNTTPVEFYGVYRGRDGGQLQIDTLRADGTWDRTAEFENGLDTTLTPDTYGRFTREGSKVVDAKPAKIDEGPAKKLVTKR